MCCHKGFIWAQNLVVHSGPSLHFEACRSKRRRCCCWRITFWGSPLLPPPPSPLEELRWFNPWILPRASASICCWALRRRSFILLLLLPLPPIRPPMVLFLSSMWFIPPLLLLLPPWALRSSWSCCVSFCCNLFCIWFDEFMLFDWWDSRFWAIFCNRSRSVFWSMYSSFVKADR